MQLHAGDRMRKEIQNYSRGNAKFLAHQEDLCEFVEAVALSKQDQLVDASRFENVTDFLLIENSDKLQAPIAMLFDAARNFHRGRTNANHSHVTHIKDAVFRNFEEDDSIRNKQKVVDDQCKQHDQTIRLILIDEKLNRKHDQPRKTYRLRQAKNLVQRPQSRFGVNAENGKQERPGWQNDCQKPQVNLNGHDGMPFQLKQRS